MEFVANYDETLFSALVASEGTEYYYYVEFSNNKKYRCTGKHNVLIVGGGLNAAVDMKIIVIPSSAAITEAA